MSLDISIIVSTGFRTNEALCQLSYEAPYLYPEGGRPGSPTCSGNVRIAKHFKLHHICKNSSLFFFGRKMANGALCLSTPNHNGKSGTEFINYCFTVLKRQTKRPIICYHIRYISLYQCWQITLLVMMSSDISHTMIGRTSTLVTHFRCSTK